MPDTGSVFELQTLLGKARDIFTIRDLDGREHEVSVVLFDHVLKQIAQLRSLHYTLCVDGGVKIEYTAVGAPIEELFDGCSHSRIFNLYAAINAQGVMQRS